MGYVEYAGHVVEAVGLLALMLLEQARVDARNTRKHKLVPPCMPVA